jgi:hypothetical protein
LKGAIVALKQEVNVPLIVTIGIVSTVVVIVLIIGTEAWYDSEAEAQFAQANAEYRDFQSPDLNHQTLLQLKQGQVANLNSYRWVDKNKGIVTMPIEDAIKLMVQTGGNPPQVDSAESLKQ